jgi:hypothetical protein
MSYSQIAEIIDSLAAELPVPTAPAPPRAPTPPTQSPQINFFADGGGVADASDNSKFQVTIPCLSLPLSRCDEFNRRIPSEPSHPPPPRSPSLPLLSSCTINGTHHQSPLLPSLPPP